MRLLSLISGGKDSWYAFYLMLNQGFEIPIIVTFLPKNKESYMLHYPLSSKVPLQIKSSNLKVRHFIFDVSGKKGVEVEEMRTSLKSLVREYRIKGIVNGAIKSEYQKQRIDFICEELGLISYSPLWHKNEETLLKEIVEDANFKFLIVDTFAEGIEKWKKKIITSENLQEFITDLKRARCNICGEGGEYETFLVSSPFLNLNLDSNLHTIL